MRNKFTHLLVFAVLFVNMFAVSALAEAAPTVTVGSASGETGTTVEIPVVLENNTGFSSLGIEIGYDDTVLKLTNVNDNSGVGASFTKAQYYTVKPYNMSWDSAENNAFNGTLVTLTFEIITDKNGDYPITVDYYKGRDGNYVDGNNVNYDEDFKPLGLNYVSGTVTVFGNDEPVIEKPCVTVGNAVGNAGDTVEIPVVLNNNTGFSSLGIEIGYDDTVLKLTNVNENSGVGASFTKAQYYTVNPYNIGWDSAANTVFNGTVATLTFEIVSSDAGTYPITVDYYKGRDGNYVDGKSVNYDEDFNPLGLTYEKGSVTVTGINAVQNTAYGSIDVRLFGGDLTGKAVVGLYSSDGVLNDLKVYPAEEKLNVTFDTGKTGAYAKIMWWENIDSMKPVCDAQIIPLQ